jgi:hypothetical protein
MMPTIRVDADVYAWLQKHAQPFEDTPNSVLRRMAALDSPTAGAELKPVKASEVTIRTNGSKTPQHEFRKPILRVLKKHGGEADRVIALRELEAVMKDQLTDFDKSDIQSGTIRWQKTAEWEVHIMRNQGLLKPVRDTRSGVWALTEEGRKAAESG